LKKGLWSIIEFVTGILPGFFLVLNFAFSDVISSSERILSFLIVIVVYLVLGAAFGLAVSDMGWKSGIWLSLPAIVLALMYSLSEIGSLVMNFLYAAAALGSSIIGSHFCARLSKKQKQ
jgi:hypothetical protein